MSSKLDKTFITAQLSQLEHHSSYWARTFLWKFVSLRMSSQLDKTFRTAHLSQLEHQSSFWAREIYNFFFASTELKTWQNIHNGSVKTLGASQLILSERKKCYFFRSEWAQNLTKTFRMAQLSHLEHHSLFWAREENEMFFRSEWSQNLTKRSERLS